MMLTISPWSTLKLTRSTATNPAKRFVAESTPWLHIDLFAWNSKDRPGRSVGAEAQAIRGTYRYLVQRFGIA